MGSADCSGCCCCDPTLICRASKCTAVAGLKCCSGDCSCCDDGTCCKGANLSDCSGCCCCDPTIKCCVSKCATAVECCDNGCSCCDAPLGGNTSGVKTAE